MGRNFDHRLIIVGAGCVIQATIIGWMFAYGVFFPTLIAEFGWSRTLLSACSSFAFLMMGFMAIPAGRLSDRIGPRKVLTFSGLFFGAGYMLMYFVEAPWQLFLIYGVFIGIGLSTHDVVTLSVIAQWFDKRRGIMTGVVKTGTAVGQILVPLLATALILAFGWRVACVVLGIAATTLLLIAAQGMREKPADTIDAASPTRADGQPHKPGIEFGQALRTRQLWTLCIVQFMFFPSLVTIPVHVVIHAMDLGLSPTRGATLLSVIGASSIIGRMCVGFAFDRVGGKLALCICFGFLISALIWLRLIETASVLYGFAVLYGIGHGGLFTVVSPTVAEFFGLRAHGSVFGVIVFFGTLGGALGPLIAGHIFDTTGHYDYAFNTLAIMASIGLLMTLSLRPLTPTRA